MAIVFHCEYCGKEIRAVDTAGGKWGKCPSCHNKVYVPSPDAEEELKLAPIDTEAEEREKQLMAETYRLTQDILMEREIPENQIASASSAVPKDQKKLRKTIIIYLKQMAEGDLSGAEKMLKTITPHRSQSLGILDQIALSELPEPELAEIPPQVLAGMIRTLRSKLGGK